MTVAVGGVAGMQRWSCENQTRRQSGARAFWTRPRWARNEGSEAWRCDWACLLGPPAKRSSCLQVCPPFLQTNPVSATLQLDFHYSFLRLIRSRTPPFFQNLKTIQLWSRLDGPVRRQPSILALPFTWVTCWAGVADGATSALMEFRAILFWDQGWDFLRCKCEYITEGWATAVGVADWLILEFTVTGDHFKDWTFFILSRPALPCIFPLRLYIYIFMALPISLPIACHPLHIIPWPQSFKPSNLAIDDTTPPWTRER